MSNFGALIRKQRRDLELTLEQVAAKAETGKAYICGIEIGRVNPPRPEVVKKIAAVLRLEELPLQMLAHAEKAPKQCRERFVEFVLGLNGK